MKIAALLYYCTDDAESRLNEEFLWRAYHNVIAVGFDAVILKIDGGIEPTRTSKDAMSFWKNWRNKWLLTKHEGINRGLITISKEIGNNDLVMPVDPHNIYSKPAINVAFQYLMKPKSKAVLQSMIPGRIRIGSWSRFRTEMTNNQLGAENCALSVIMKGTILKQFCNDYLMKLDPKDDSWWMAHAEKWIRETMKEDTEYIIIPDSGDHDDKLTMFQHLQSIYQNGEKAGRITEGKLPPQVQMRVNLGRMLPQVASTRWMELEAAIFDLGYIKSKYQVGGDTGYVDLNYRLRPEPPDLAGCPYMFSADKYAVGSIADLGCGDGRFLIHFWSMRPHYHMPMPGKNADQYRHGGDEPHSGISGFPFGTGVDVSPVAIETAEKEAKDTMKTLNFVLDDFVNWRVDEPPALGIDSYDTVVMLEVLEHLSDADRKKALDVAWKIARHRIIVTVPLREVNEPSHLKPFWSMKEAEELWKDYMVKVVVSYADMSRWLIVAEKREVPK